MSKIPHSVLFVCDHNAIRSPMAEAILKSLIGQKIYVQSAGVKHDLDIDGFAIKVCQEIGVELAYHQPRAITELDSIGEAIDGFDLVITFSPASLALAQEATKSYSTDVEYWEIAAPKKSENSREVTMDNYRKTRDAILSAQKIRFADTINQNEQ